MTLAVAVPVFTAPLSNQYWVQLASFAAAGLMAVKAFKGGTVSRPTRSEATLFAFCAYALLSLLWADARSTAKLSAIAIEYGGVVVLFSMVRRASARSQEWRFLGQCYVAGCLAGAGIVLWNWTSGTFQEVEGRYSIAGVTTNYTAYSLATAIPVLLALHEARTRRSPLGGTATVLSFVVIALAIGLTGCRGATIALLISAAVIFTKALRRRPMLATVAAVIIAGVLWARASELLDILPTRLVPADANTEDISSGRFELWGQALDIFERNPVFGSGADSYLSVSGSGVHAHNVFLSLLAELGVAGFVLFSLSLSAVILTLFRTAELSSRRWSSAALLGAWSVIAFTGVWQYATPAWIAFGWFAAKPRASNGPGSGRGAS